MLRCIDPDGFKNVLTKEQLDRIPPAIGGVASVIAASVAIGVGAINEAVGPTAIIASTVIAYVGGAVVGKIAKASEEQRAREEQVALSKGVIRKVQYRDLIDQTRTTCPVYQRLARSYQEFKAHCKGVKKQCLSTEHKIADLDAQIATTKNDIAFFCDEYFDKKLEGLESDRESLVKKYQTYRRENASLLKPGACAFKQYTLALHLEQKAVTPEEKKVAKHYTEKFLLNYMEGGLEELDPQRKTVRHAAEKRKNLDRATKEIQKAEQQINEEQEEAVQRQLGKQAARQAARQATIVAAVRDVVAGALKARVAATEAALVAQKDSEWFDIGGRQEASSPGSSSTGGSRGGSTPELSDSDDNSWELV